MSALRNHLFLLSLLVTTGVRAQLSPQLPPAAVQQIMTQQQPVDVSQQGNIQTTATFDPPTVRAGELTFYRVTVNATENSVTWPAQITAPAGLTLSAGIRGQVSRVEFNQFHPLTSFAYEVRAAAPGHYVIPSFTILVNGNPLDIPAVGVDVVAGNAAPPAAPPRRLWLELSQTNLYFGQPVRARVILPAGANNQIDSLNEVQLDGTGFMTDKLVTRQAVEAVNHNGQTVNAYIYETVAIPLATGPVPIAAQGFTAGRNFNGPITITGSGTVVISGGPPQYILLSSEPVTLNVRPLPVDGQLPGFTGAVGKFGVDKPILSTNRVRVGEPLHLRYAFRAFGGLTHFVPPVPPRSRDWQVIPDEPAETGLTLIPLADDVTSTPEIPFSAFDPDTGNYYDLTVPAATVTVLGDGLATQLPAWSAEDTNAAPLKLSGLTMLPGKSAASLRPLQLQGWFIALQLLPVAGFIVLWRWDARNRFLEAHPEIVRRRKARRDLRREKSRLQTAVAGGDAAGFVTHAAAAMSIAAAPHFPAEARALVGGDVLSQLDETARNGAAGETVRKIFAATAAQFAAAPATLDLLSLRGEVEAVLQLLEERL